MEFTYFQMVGIMFALFAGRYFVMAGGTYYYFWVLNKNKYVPQKIQLGPFSSKRVRQEFLNSMLTSVIGGFVLALPWLPALAPYNKVYSDSLKYGATWLVLSIPFLIIAQDTYFYWMHRAIHSPMLYRFVHREHHESRDPSPFAAYSFHWSEAILEVAWFLPLMFLIPFSHLSMAIFGVVSLAVNINGHLGVELYPESFKQNSVLKWMNSATAHNYHHKYFKGNYGFFFTFWDRLMGTYVEKTARIARPMTTAQEIEARPSA